MVFGEVCEVCNVSDVGEVGEDVDVDVVLLGLHW